MLKFLICYILVHIAGSWKQGKPWILRLVVVSCLSLAAKMENTDFSISNFQVIGRHISPFIGWQYDMRMAMETYDQFKQQNRETKLVSSLTTKQLTEWSFSFLIPWIGEWDRSHLSLLCISSFPYRSLKIQHWLKLSRTELRRLFLKLKMVIVNFSQNVYFSCI